MAAKKKGLPELNVDKGSIVDSAKKAVEIRTIIAQNETKEKELRGQIETSAVTLRETTEQSGKYIGLIRITDETAPVRVEFKMVQTKAALDVSEESNLDTVYGPSRPLLFERSKIVTAITDPTGLIEQLKAEGKNPWDFLEIRVKNGMDSLLAGSDKVVASEALVPAEGFLNTLNDVSHTLTERGKQFTSEYLKTALKPTVVLGTKGKA